MIERQKFFGTLWHNDAIGRNQKAESLMVVGREWSDNSGNTFHTAEAWIDGIYIGKSDITYGHGESAILHTALTTALDIPHGRDPLRYAETKHALRVACSVAKVGRKRDL